MFSLVSIVLSNKVPVRRRYPRESPDARIYSSMYNKPEETFSACKNFF